MLILLDKLLLADGIGIVFLNRQIVIDSHIMDKILVADGIDFLDRQMVIDVDSFLLRLSGVFTSCLHLRPSLGRELILLDKFLVVDCIVFLDINKW